MLNVSIETGGLDLVFDGTMRIDSSSGGAGGFGFKISMEPAGLI